MKIIIILGWVTVVSSLFLMVAGHLGVHELNWVSSQISTYAATAPGDNLITASILFASFSFLIIGLLISKYKVLGTGFVTHLTPALTGAAAGGLIMLAYFEETARTLSMLQQSGFWAIRIQSFHDAGLLLFYYSSLVLVMLLGLIGIFYYSDLRNKIFAGIIFSMGPVSYFFMTSHWATFLGWEGTTMGLNQRVALLCLWLSVTLMLVLISKKMFYPARGENW